MFTNDAQLDRIAQRTEQIIVVARAVARAALGDMGVADEANILRIAQMIMTREAAELIGFEVSAKNKTGK